MRRSNGQIESGCHLSPMTEFKKGQHWRAAQEFRHKEWLVAEYTENQRSTSDIAAQFGVTDTAIFFWLRKHGIPRRTISQARKVKRWGSSGAKNPMFGKRGSECASWKGGCTPERQAFHGSREWAEASLAVWRRDNGTCRRCAAIANKSPGTKFDVHHIVGFEVVALRAVVRNLVLLCRKCHRFVHSKGNINRDYLQES